MSDETEKRDLKLIEAWLDGDEYAARELHDRYFRRVLRMIEQNTSKKFGSKFDPEDVAQSVFRSLFRGVREGRLLPRNEDGMWGLLRNIILWKVRNRARFYGTQKRSVGKEVAAAEFLSILSVPSESDAIEAEELLAELLASLREPEKKTLELLLDGKQAREIAAHLSVTNQSVQRYKQKIRQELEALLAKLNE